MNRGNKLKNLEVRKRSCKIQGILRVFPTGGKS